MLGEAGCHASSIRGHAVLRAPSKGTHPCQRQHRVHAPATALTNASKPKACPTWIPGAPRSWNIVPRCLAEFRGTRCARLVAAAPSTRQRRSVARPRQRFRDGTARRRRRSKRRSPAPLRAKRRSHELADANANAVVSRRTARRREALMGPASPVIVQHAGLPDRAVAGRLAANHFLPPLTRRAARPPGKAQPRALSPTLPRSLGTLAPRAHQRETAGSAFAPPVATLPRRHQGTVGIFASEPQRSIVFD